jgi:predicted sulfurtransferase
MTTVLLFYKYIQVENPEEIKNWQREICSSLGMTGRIIVAKEGINGTLGCSLEAAQIYIDAMNNHPLFSHIDFKTSEGGPQNFPRLSIKVKEEITKLGISPEKLTPAQAGVHLTPQETHNLLQNQPDDLIILDGRNDYEARVGRFEGAICPPVRYFREFPAYIDENVDLFKDKQVLMYCTGGIRCERASAYLKEKGIAKEVYQITGGIHRYAEEFPDGFFRGKNYVFDSRMIQKVNDDIMTHCDWCMKSCDSLTCCINSACNKQYVTCAPCLEMSGSTCSQTCKELVERKEVRVREIPRNTVYQQENEQNINN